MYFTRNPFPNFLPFFLFISTIFNLTPHSHSATDYTTLVYKGCAKQLLPDPNSAAALSSLFGTLVSQSSKSRFSKATTQTSPTITALFQCRGDLPNPDCYSCVARLPRLMDKLCGKVVAARVQLLGCYMLYEGPGFAQISGMQMVFRKCSGPSLSGPSGNGFAENRDNALSAVVNGVSGGGGFFAGGVGGVYVLGQCEGDLGASDCVECVKSGVGRVRGECGSSAGGQVYLHKCFVGYGYYPNGVPRRSSSSSASGPNTGKTVAIILGGAAGVGFLVICLLFARGLLKKKDDY